MAKNSRKHFFPPHDSKLSLHNQKYYLRKNLQGIFCHWFLNRSHRGIRQPQSWTQRKRMDQSLRQWDRPTNTRSTTLHEDRHQHIIFHPPNTITQTQDPILHLNLWKSPPTQGRTTTSQMECKSQSDHVHRKSKHTNSRTYHSQRSCKQHHLPAQRTMYDNGNQRILYWNPYSRIRIFLHTSQTCLHINYWTVLIPRE